MSSEKIVSYFTRDSLSAEDMEFSEREKGFLEDFNAGVGGRESFKDVMTMLFEMSAGICPCDRLGVAFVEDNGHRIVSRWNRATYESLTLVEGYAEDLRGSSLEEVLSSGRVRLITDLEKYAAAKPESRSTKLILKEGICSSMTCPLIVDGRIVGVMFRSSRTPNAYGRRQLALHLGIAGRLSQAVEKCYRLDQLRAANKAYFEMLGFVTHELKNPVASMVTDAHALLGGYLGELTDSQKAKLERMVAKGDYLLSLVQDYLDLSRLEGGDVKPSFEKVDSFIQTVVEPAVEIVLPMVEEKKMSLMRCFSDVEVSVECDPRLMKIVMVNLMGNAAKYGRQDGEIRLKVEEHSSVLMVSVRNQGVGFADSERSKLFRKFSRLNSTELLKQKGTGVGLYTTWKIIQMHGGRITARSKEGEWAEFAFAIPKSTVS